MTNVSSIALGLNEVRDGAALTASGVAHIAEGIIASWSAPMRWSYGEGDNLVEGFFSFESMYQEVRRPDGSADSRALTAKYQAVATEHGVNGEFGSSDKVQFKRAWQLAAAERLGAGIVFANEKVTRNGKPATLRIVKAPAGAVLDLYKEDGSPTEAGKVLEADMERAFELANKEVEPEALVAAVKNTMVKCNGGKLGNIKLPSVSDTSNKLAAFAVKAGLMAEKKGRNRDGQPDEGKRFTDALAFVSTSLDLVLDPEGQESNFAPCDAIDESLHKLQEKISSYFAMMYDPQAGE